MPDSPSPPAPAGADGTNAALRAAMTAKSVGISDLARQIGVDERTVRNWSESGQVPQRQTAARVAAFLEVLESDLWPRRAGTTTRHTIPAREDSSEWVRAYTERSRVPSHIWRTMITNARESIDILELSGSYIAQVMRIDHILSQKQADGVQIRVALGNPEGQACRQRSSEENRAPDFIGQKILTMLKILTRDGVPLVPIRVHDRTLYSSLLRADNEMLINMHLLGQAASYNPVIHVTKAGPLFQQFNRHFEGLWKSLEGELGSASNGTGRSPLEGELTERHASILARWGVSPEE